MFSKVLVIVTLHSKWTKALSFENAKLGTTGLRLCVVCVCVCARVYDHRSEAACKALAWEEECTRISSSERETALRCDKLLRDLEFSAQDHAAANSAMEQVYRSLLTLIHIYRSLLTLRSRSRYLRHGTGERAQESCARHKVRRGCWQVKPGCKQRMQAAHN